MIPSEDLDIVAAIQSGAEISVCIPEDIPSQQLFDAIHQFGRMISRSDRYGRALRYGFGRLMTMAARREGFLHEHGFKKFKDFEDAMVAETGLDRSTLWEWKPVAEHLPRLTREQLSSISIKHLTLILKIPDNTRRHLALGAASEMSYRAFQRYTEDKGFIGEGESDGASLIITGTKSEIQELRDFLDAPAIKKYAGNYVQVLLALVGEAKTSEMGWPKI